MKKFFKQIYPTLIKTSLYILGLLFLFTMMYAGIYCISEFFAGRFFNGLVLGITWIASIPGFIIVIHACFADIFYA